MKRTLLVVALCAVALVLGLLALGLGTFLIGAFTPLIEGRALSYSDLMGVRGIEHRRDYFPLTAKNICFSFRDCGRGNIIGEFDITEKEFFEWADALGWQVAQIPPSRLRYGSRVPVKRGYHFASRDFELAYDTEKQRAYFVDLGFHDGPPRGTKRNCTHLEP